MMHINDLTKFKYVCKEITVLRTPCWLLRSYRSQW